MKPKFETREELLQDAINYYWGRPERKCTDGISNCLYYPPDVCKEHGTVDVGLYCNTDHDPDLTIYGGDIYYIKGNRLYTESGEIDSTFNTYKELSIFLEEHSAQTYKDAIMWEMKRCVTDYSSVMVFNDGEIMFNFCSPYEDMCEEIILNNKDCDNYGSCMYYSDPQATAGNIKPLNK